MDAVIKLHNLTKAYKNGRGIFDLNLEINKGEIFGFLGPNGAGKTTAMKIMTGLLKADQGTVELAGYDVSTNFEQATSKVGSIIETAECYTYMTAYQNLKQSARYYNDVDSKRIDEVLELCGMINFKNERVQNFSLGMKQRIGIANAILSKPEIIILDEPLNGLDVEGMVDMRKLFKYLAEVEHSTIFISSHLIHDVELTCNRIGIIFGGRIKSVEYMDKILSTNSSLENYFISEVNESAAV